MVLPEDPLGGTKRIEEELVNHGKIQKSLGGLGWQTGVWTAVEAGSCVSDSNHRLTERLDKGLRCRSHTFGGTDGELNKVISRSGQHGRSKARIRLREGGRLRSGLCYERSKRRGCYFLAKRCRFLQLPATSWSRQQPLMAVSVSEGLMVV